jgi:hypothetical protein
VYFSFIRLFDLNKFQLAFQWFFSGIETLQTFEKKAFYGLKKNVGHKKSIFA